MNQTSILSPKLNQLLQDISRKERKSFQEVMENALLNYYTRQLRWTEIRKWGIQTAEKYKISKMENIEKIIDEFRQ